MITENFSKNQFLLRKLIKTFSLKGKIDGFCAAPLVKQEENLRLTLFISK